MTNEHLRQISRSLARKESIKKGESYADVYRKILPGTNLIASLLIGQDESSKKVRSTLLKRLVLGREYLIASTNLHNFKLYLSKEIMEVPGGLLDKTNYLKSKIHLGWVHPTQEDSVFSLLSPEQVRTPKDLGKKIASTILENIRMVYHADYKTRLNLSKQIVEQMKPINLQVSLEKLVGV